MTRSLQDLLDKARQTPPHLSMEEFEELLDLMGWTKDGNYGPDKRNAVWIKDGVPLTIEPGRDGRARAIQVKHFLNTL